MKMNEPLSLTQLNSLSMLALAQVGDAVYELLVRSMLASEAPSGMQELHRRTVAWVRAEAQAAVAQNLRPLLTEEEEAVYRRGRNSKVHGIPQHANPGEYHSATGLEALFGWLYLQGKTDRIRELFTAITEAMRDGA
ncbi:MAG: ribonuclease III [Oscillospiraceae bacterium]|nr:ribonuclease III [Oscillospiraceae bacterium]